MPHRIFAATLTYDEASRKYCDYRRLRIHSNLPVYLNHKRRGGAVGINNNDLALMIGLRSQGYIANGASIVEIGAQQLSGDILRSPESLVAIARAFEVEPRSFGSAKPALTGQSGEETLDPNAP